MDLYTDLKQEHMQGLGNTLRNSQDTTPEASRLDSSLGARPVQEEMAKLGAEGVSDGLCSPRAGGLPAAPGGLAVVGGRVNIFCSGVGIWCRGEVLAFDPAKEVGLCSFPSLHSVVDAHASLHHPSSCHHGCARLLHC